MRCRGILTGLDRRLASVMSMQFRPLGSLNERRVIVVPDILANAGGVVVSYFEWVQDLQCFFWDEEEVNRNLKRIMERSFKEVWDFSQEQEVSLRLGAYMLAVDRVAGAVHARGVFP